MSADLELETRRDQAWAARLDQPIPSKYLPVEVKAGLCLPYLFERVRHMREAGVPGRFMREQVATFLTGGDDLCDELSTDAMRQAGRLHNRPGRGREGILAVLASLPGRGKSHAGAWLLSIEGGLWVHAPDLAIVREAGRNEKTLDDKMREATVLVLDDVGIEHSRTGWAQARIIGAIECREADEIPTLVTTNLSSEEFCKRYDGVRLASRIDRDGIGFVTCGGVDLRQNPRRFSPALLGKADKILGMNSTEMRFAEEDYNQEWNKIESDFRVTVPKAIG